MCSPFVSAVGAPPPYAYTVRIPDTAVKWSMLLRGNASFVYRVCYNFAYGTTLATSRYKRSCAACPRAYAHCAGRYTAGGARSPTLCWACRKTYTKGGPSKSRPCDTLASRTGPRRLAGMPLRLASSPMTLLSTYATTRSYRRCGRSSALGSARRP